jgi:hypothetical protein
MLIAMGSAANDKLTVQGAPRYLARVMEPGTNVVETAFYRRACASKERGGYNFATANLGLGKTKRDGPANERKTSWICFLSQKLIQNYVRKFRPKLSNS